MGKSLLTASTQWRDFGMMAMSQQMTMPRVVAEQQTNTYPQVISAQRTDSGLMAVLQRMTAPRVVTRPQANISPVAKSVHPCRQNTPMLGRNASHAPERREVRMIFGGSREVGDSRCAGDKYLQNVKKPPQTVAHITGSKPLRGYTTQPNDIIFTHADTS